VIDRTRLSVRAVLVSALLLAVGAAGSAPAIAADDPYVIQLPFPCHQALAEETRAASLLRGPDATPEDARRTLRAVNDALTRNNKACGIIARRSARDNAVSKQMHDVNEAFLLSLRAQADTVLHNRLEAYDYSVANRKLDACLAAANLSPSVHRDCQTQIDDNRATRSQSMPTANDPCQVALVAANNAGDALKAKDYASFVKAYQRATDGLAANKNCTRHPQMRDINSAYLLTWKTVADRYLDIPFRNDRDITNAADPFQVPNDLFAKCGTSYPPLPQPVKSDCAAQLATNQRFWRDYLAQAPSYTGQTAQPLSWQQIDWPYPLRSDFVWDAGCKNNENARCADEAVRDGSGQNGGQNGWGHVAQGQAAPIDGDRERALFATIRNCDDLHRLFGGQPPQFTCDLFKSNIVLVTAQHEPNQQCDMTIDRVNSIAAPASTNPPRDAVQLFYTLNCAPPVLGSTGSTAMKVISIPSGNTHGSFANVTFVQSGGGGPRSGTP